jgi:hypothetical protein
MVHIYTLLLSFFLSIVVYTVYILMNQNQNYYYASHAALRW